MDAREILSWLTLSRWSGTDILKHRYPDAPESLAEMKSLFNRILDENLPIAPPAFRQPVPGEDAGFHLKQENSLVDAYDEQKATLLTALARLIEDDSAYEVFHPKAHGRLDRMRALLLELREWRPPS